MGTASLSIYRDEKREAGYSFLLSIHPSKKKPVQQRPMIAYTHSQAARSFERMSFFVCKSDAHPTRRKRRLGRKLDCLARKIIGILELCEAHKLNIVPHFWALRFPSCTGRILSNCKVLIADLWNRDGPFSSPKRGNFGVAAEVQFGLGGRSWLVCLGAGHAAEGWRGGGDGRSR